MWNAYTKEWTEDRYLFEEASEFTYTGNRSERARDLPGDPARTQVVAVADSPADPMAIEAATTSGTVDFDEFGFPNDVWDSPPPGYGQDEHLVDRSVHDFQSRHVDNGAPAHRLRAQRQLDDVSETDRSGFSLDPEARLIPNPSGPDAERLTRGFNAYAGNNSFERHPHEAFIRQDRSMHDPAGLESFYDVRPLWYNRSATPHDAPSTATDGNWGFVFDAWDSFTPEYLAEAPYDRKPPMSPALETAPLNEALEDWGW